MAEVIPLRPPTRRPAGIPEREARLPQSERLQSGQRFGSIDGPYLSSILDKLDRGEVADWMDLVQFILGTDPDIYSLYDSVVSRVTQAEWQIEPNPFGDPMLAGKARDFCANMIMPRIEEWAQSLRRLAGAVAGGFAVAEKDWVRDNDLGYWYIARLIHVRPGRMRYGPQWDLRLHDKGLKRGADGYGRILQPNGWVTHFHPAQDGYPSTYGLMKACVWPWLFTRFGDKSQVLLVEKHGHPLVYGKVNPDTPDNIRAQFLAGLQSLSYDHVAILEEGNTIEVVDMKSKEGSDVHDSFLARQLERITRVWLGTSDANSPGLHGSQAAVSERLGAFTDPRMVVMGDMLASTIQRDIFKSSIELNTHVFGLPASKASLIPTPVMRFKTADDEVKTDLGDKAAEEGQQDSRTQVQVPGQKSLTELVNGESEPTLTELVQGEEQPTLGELVQEKQATTTKAKRPSARATKANHPALKSRDERLDGLIASLGDASRVIICGGPNHGKSTLASLIADRYGLELKRTDSLLAGGNDLHWSEQSLYVSRWFDQQGQWVIEGTTATRALRKWLDRNPRTVLQATVIYLRDAVADQDPKQHAMSKGDWTVWNEVKAKLARHGVKVLEF